VFILPTLVRNRELHDWICFGENQRQTRGENVNRNGEIVQCPRLKRFYRILVTISIAPASEGTCWMRWKAREAVRVYESRNSCEIVRKRTAQPLEIRVVNASEIGNVDKMMKVSRDDTGKLTGAIIAPISLTMILGCMICVLAGLYVGIIVGQDH